jgi:hypothetical protein
MQQLKAGDYRAQVTSEGASVLPGVGPNRFGLGLLNASAR